MADAVLDAQIVVWGIAKDPEGCPATCCREKFPASRKLIADVQSGKRKLPFTPLTHAKYASCLPGTDFINLLWPDWVALGRAVQVSARDEGGLQKQLRKLGLSSDDIHFAVAAQNSNSRQLISDDPDFWDSKLKSMTHNKKEAAKRAGKGITRNALAASGISLFWILSV